jgi:hypothetical protein
VLFPFACLPYAPHQQIVQVQDYHVLVALKVIQESLL